MMANAVVNEVDLITCHGLMAFRSELLGELLFISSTWCKVSPCSKWMLLAHL